MAGVGRSCDLAKIEFPNKEILMGYVSRSCDFPNKEILMAYVSRSHDLPKRVFLMAYISKSVIYW